ncbi:MAG: IS66 family transposase [Victivallales bacterium]
MAHWTDHLRRKISEQERLIALLSSAAKENAEAVKRLDEVEIRRAEAVKRICSLEVENSRLRSENLSLGKQILDHDDLMKELARREERIRELEKQLNRRSGLEDPYGLATPSSKRVTKRNSTAENQARIGGARPGHRGNGRESFSQDEADLVVHVDDASPRCDCGCEWADAGTAEHSAYHLIPAKMEKRIYIKQLRKCPSCGNVSEAFTPGTMPGCLYDNSVIANALVEHYLHGMTTGSIHRRLGINRGTFLGIAHRCAGHVRPLFDEILSGLRGCELLHADETGWMKDGTKAYAWLFANDRFKVFLFRDTRGSCVPKEALGDENPELVLVTDRYSGYSPLNVRHQYCFVHLLRDVKEEEVKFPEDPEVLSFASDIKPLLSDAISLRSLGLPIKEYTRRAGELKAKIMATCNRQANHPAVQHLQDIFREKHDDLFQWVRSPLIPADNNYAERELRPTVIARKISFGSQSEKGMSTREILMTVIHTAKSRGHDPAQFLEDVLNALSADKSADLSSMLDGKKTVKAA